jgi:hypothetical protein
MPLLGGRYRRALAAAASRVPRRRIDAVVGNPGREVRQGFELASPIPAPLQSLAVAINEQLNRTLVSLSPPPSPAFAFNEWRLQYYPVAGCGISPHRDHRAYRHLVAIVVLAGRARFLVCDDRDGRGARAVMALPGWLILMRATGFAGSSSRPFHAVLDVERPRWMLGLRCLGQA